MSFGKGQGDVNVVPGLGTVAGAALANHPRIKRMSFTGSPEVGKLVGAACGGNLVPVKLELGGKEGAVVFDDVDIEETSDNFDWGRAYAKRRSRLCNSGSTRLFQVWL